MDQKIDIQLFGTSNLCFDKDLFMGVEFNVDDFMRDYQCNGDGNLEMLRDHLGIYLKILRSAMIDLINRDYADFVNLSTNLTGLDNLIQTLSVPLGQLREEVLSVSQLLKNVSTGVLSDLDQQKTLQKYKRKLNTLTEITTRLANLENLVEQYMNNEEKKTTSDLSPFGSETENCLENDMKNICLEACSDEELFDCFAAELSHLNYLVKICKDTNLIAIYKLRLAKLQTTAENVIENNIIKSLSESGEDVKLMQKTLIVSSTLDCAHIVEAVVQHMITPAIKDLISENSLRSNPRGLAGVFSTVMSCVQTKLLTLLQLTVPQRQNNSAVPEVVHGFMFLEHSIFPEVIAALSDLPDFFSPANPTTFHQKYEQCINFILNLEEMLVTKQRVEIFRQLSSYITFMEKWNFAVYFQIRNQEIGQVVESSLCVVNNSVSVGEVQKGSLILQSGKSVLRAIHQCWLPEVFLQPLLHRFWKMTLLILSRHRTWLTDTVKYLQKSESSDTTAKSTNKLNKSLEMSVFLLSDLHTLQDKIKELFTHSIHEHLEHASKDHRKMICDILELESKKLSPFIDELLKFVSEGISTSMIAALQPVTDTPRLYRRTNRSAPTHSQPYVAASIAPLQDLNKVASPLLPRVTLLRTFSEICVNLTSQYYLLTNDVLASVSKTEESLKRLKRARKGASTSSNQSTGLSDEDKIREQLYEDVKQLSNLLMNDIGVDVSELPDLIKLTDTVNEARTANNDK